MQALSPSILFGSDIPGTQTGSSTWEQLTAYLLNGAVTDQISGTQGLLTPEMKAQLPPSPHLGVTTIKDYCPFAHQKQPPR